MSGSDELYIGRTVKLYSLSFGNGSIYNVMTHTSSSL